MAATVALCHCVLARGRELRHPTAAPTAALLHWAAGTVVVLAGSAVAAVPLGR